MLIWWECDFLNYVPFKMKIVLKVAVIKMATLFKHRKNLNGIRPLTSWVYPILQSFIEFGPFFREGLKNKTPASYIDRRV